MQKQLHNRTRLLGRPQPQMYPPVALNQYTLVNRTHKHYMYIYASRPHKHLKITPKLNNMQNMEVIWWPFFQIFVLILGGLGETYVESRGTKLSRRHHHTGYICTTRKNNGNHGRGQTVWHVCENINIFGYMGGPGGGGGGGGAWIIRLGPSWFTYTLYLIIIYISNIKTI